MQLPPGYLYGSSLRSRIVSSFELSERVYAPRFKTPKHSHKRPLFCFVMQGDYTETYGVKTRECRSSTLLFHPAGELHAESFHDSGGRSFIIEVDPTWLERLRDYFAVEESSSSLSGGELEMVVRKLYKEFVMTDDASTLVIEGLMLEMVGEASRRGPNEAPNHQPRWLKQAKELLRERFAERLTLADVAQTVGVHPVHLAQTFHKSYRCTVGEYVRRLRIEYACNQLATSERAVVDIALAAGFCDQSHFTRTFKRCTGVSPSQYRSTARGD
jgi:AraC family transcriptional regulator